MLRISEFIETIKLAFDSLRQAKLRSFLASLGVVIGISFVLMMGWIIGGLDRALQETFNIIGVDMLYIDKWAWAGGKNWKLLRQRKDITMEEYERFRSMMQGAEVTFPVVRQWGTTVKYGSDYYEGLSISGTTYDQVYAPSGDVIQGRYFSPFEDNMGTDVIVLGFNVNKAIFPNDNGIGKIIKIKGRKFTVIGVIRKQGTAFFDMMDNVSYIPIKSFFKTFGKFRRSISIGVKAGSEKKLDDVREESIAIMRKIRGLKPGEDDDFSINETKAFEKNVETLRGVVWGVGIGMTVLSFIVGSIGIMNIMFVSVTERTKEIGIRKAIGAKKRSIWLQFIVESSFLCFVGAITAFILLSGIVYLAATFLPKFVPELSFLEPFLQVQLLGIATVVSVIVGMLAGLMPAVRASNLDPVDALRYE